MMLENTLVGDEKDKICPQVKEGTPEYFADQTNLISDPAYLKELYNKNPRPAPKTPKNADDFFKNLPANGQEQFQPIEDQDVGDDCMNIRPCTEDDNIKRTIAGECNNPRFPMWGVTGVNLVHITPPDYADKEDKIRTTKNGQPLMNARKLHLEVIPGNPVESNHISYAFVIVAQLVSHETGRIMDQRPASGTTCLCCTNHWQMIPEDQRADVCQPIEIPDKDPFYSQFNVRCMNFVRSLTTNEMDCHIEPDQKLDDVSHYIDASAVYGSTAGKCNSLREFNGGRLRAETEDSKEFMPTVAHPETACFNTTTCFNAGDDRANQNWLLAVIHLMLFRFHNEACAQLQKLNPHWDDEKTFQEGRTIVISVLQHITYEQLLPIVIGKDFAISHNLSGIQTLRSDLYSEFENPGTLVEFTSAAWRLFHTMVPPKVKLCDKDGTVTEEHMLSDTFQNPSKLKGKDKVNQIIYGMVYQPANKMNTGVTQELTNLMFKSTQKHGLDLVAMDILRGREHGVTNYPNMRVACGLTKPKSFADLVGIMSPENIEKLQRVYNSIEDMDTYMAMFAENLIPDTLVGPLLRCIIKKQFERWQRGDKFYYTFSNSGNPLTEAKLQEILKTSLSMIFCMCGDNIEQMTPNAFLLPGPGNEMVPCSKIPKMSFDPWKEPH